MADSEADELYQTAWEAHRHGRDAEALSLLARAISIAPCNKVKSAYLTTKGGVLNRNKQHAQAVEACTEAIALEPNNFYAFSQLGIAEMKLRHYKAAAEALQSAANIRTDHNVLTVLAKAQLQFNPSAARVSAERALELEPSWDEAKAIYDAARNAEDSIE